MIFKRFLCLPQKHHLLLLGPRNTGKSTLLAQSYPKKTTYWIDLLDYEQEDRFSRNPKLLEEIASSLPSDVTHIVIDEIQTIPALLNEVHRLIEKPILQCFVLSGSSARKLKHGGANLLAGRAFVYHLSALTTLELSSHFNLERALQFGMLPALWVKNYDAQESQLFLSSYAHTYLKEEIWAEQFVKKLDPFRKFLEVAAQSSGKIINYSNISRDVGVDIKTIQNYYSLLEDTMIGYFIEPFSHSFRKRLIEKPRFYFFDVGVMRALSRQLSLPPTKGTSYYGELFEHFVINECVKLAQLFYPDFRFSFLKTKDGAEVDLIVDRPGKPLLMIEIKSSASILPSHLCTLKQLSTELQAQAVVLSQDSIERKVDDIYLFPWEKGIKKLFCSADSLI